MSPGPGSTTDISNIDVAEWAQFGSGNIATVAASGAAQTLPLAQVASTSWITLTAACTITVPPPIVVGEKRRVFLVQDATGTRIVTWVATGGAIKWAGAAAPTLSTAAGKTDRIELESLDGVNWVGIATLNIS